ncbi:pre-mRNA splicing factor SR-like 1 isoform X1 [Sesamum indicum]|uniref:Pre-mRNA-splicing factor 38 n=1 Tax=Sesamum indicum TaxID=4182 RepID=A0A6I9ULM1_SESIN|nr:pre-mRNA splicing factor SR-like 1 isoform X1 [Sesamum indicum]
MAEIKSSGRPIDQLLEKVLCMNILSSDYFRDLLRLKTYHEVIDEIYVTVTHVEPWMTGNCRGPSTAFCLLYKFFTMKLTVKQMHGLLKHPDSPYIRAIGFLYLRYIADPKTLWSWYEPYLKDDEEFSPGSDGRMTTMGVYIRDLLLGQYYFDTLFPRIPVPVMRTIVANLENMKLPTKHCGVTGESTRGSEETSRRPPSVKAALSVSFGQRAPHRASTRDSSPVRRTSTPSYDRDDDSRRSSNRRRSQSRDVSDREYADRDRDREMDRGRKRDRSHDRDRDRDREREMGRDRESVRERGRERGRDRRYDYDRRSGDSCRRYYDSHGSDHDEHYYREGSSHHSKSRSRSIYGHDQHRPSPSGQDSKERTSASSNLAKLKDLYGDLSNQKEDAGKDKGPNRPSGTEEVIRLGGSTWR